jgi:hypothetical protein
VTRASALGLPLLLALALGCTNGGASGMALVSTSPTPNATGVSTAATIRFTFSAAANTGSLAYTCVPSVALTAAWGAGDTQLTLTPAAPLAVATSYTVTITALSSDAGAPLTGTAALTFTTAGGGGGGDLVVWRYPGGDAKPPTLAFETPARPAKGASVADPVYHTPVTRVTDRATDGYASDAIMNEYSRVDPENPSGTYALLRGTDGVWYLYSVATWGLVRVVDFRGNPDPEPRWHPTDPDLVFFVEGLGFWQYRVSTNTSTLLHDFTGEAAGAEIARSKFEGDPSGDGRYWAFSLDDTDQASWTTLRVVCYDRQTDQIVGRLTAMPQSTPNWVGMDMSGTHVVAGMEDGSTFAWHRDFSHEVQLGTAIGHCDVARTSGGTDVLVYQNAATDWIAMADLETGAETNLVPIPFGDNTDLGLHISAARDVPGWVLVSTCGAGATALSWMDRCLFMLELQSTPAVWRICQTWQLQEPDPNRDYFGEAFAAVNGAGTRVWWGGNWNGTGANARRYEAFVAELPPNWDAAVLGAL